MTKLNAPFTGDQVESINGYQQSNKWHPFTCGKVHCGGILTATKNGLFCRKCGNWKQYWVHDFMANWDWKWLNELELAAEKGVDEFNKVLQERTESQRVSGGIINEENGKTGRDEV